MSESHLADWDTIAGVPTRDQRFINLGDWEIDQAVADLQASLGEIPIGATINTFIIDSKGVDAGSGPNEIKLMHNGDYVILSGGKSGTKFHFERHDQTRVKRGIGSGWLVSGGQTYSDWTSKWQKYDKVLQAGETWKVTCTENGETSNMDIIISLIDVLVSPEEIEAKRKQAELDKTLTDPNATPQAKALAETQYAIAQQQAQSAAAAAAAQSQAQQGAAMGATIESVAVPLIVVAGAGMFLWFAWLYFGKEG